MKNKQIMLKNNTNGNHFIFAIDEIKSIRYKEDSQVLLKNIAILGSAIYAWWGFLQSSNDYYSRNDINTKVFIFTTGAAGFGYLFGSLIGYPVQRGYNLFRAKWSDILIINERNWRILNQFSILMLYKKHILFACFIIEIIIVLYYYTIN